MALPDATFNSGGVTCDVVYRSYAPDELRAASYTKVDGVYARVSIASTACVADVVCLNVLVAEHAGALCTLALRFALPRATWSAVHALCKRGGFAYRRSVGSMGGWTAPMTDDRASLLAACTAEDTIAARIAAHLAETEASSCASPSVLELGNITIDTRARPAFDPSWRATHLAFVAADVEVPEQRAAREAMRALRARGREAQPSMQEAERERKRAFMKSIMVGSYTDDGRWVAPEDDS